MKTDNLLEKLQAQNPKRNVAFTAVDQLKEEDQIRLFFQQYIDFLRSNGVEEPESVAGINIGYVLGFGYSEETIARWRMMPVSSPYFGIIIPSSMASC